MTFSPYAEKPKIFLEEARQEMKRAEHLMFVSLKYTRTVDVIRSIIERMISAMDAAVISGIDMAKETNPTIFDVPSNFGLRLKLFKEIYPTELTDEMIVFLQYLKRIVKAEYKSSKEFRRHVTLSVILDEGILHVDIDKMREYYDKCKSIIEKLEFAYSGQPVQ